MVLAVNFCPPFTGEQREALLTRERGELRLPIFNKDRGKRRDSYWAKLGLPLKTWKEGTTRAVTTVLGGAKESKGAVVIMLILIFCKVLKSTKCFHFIKQK